MFKKGLSVFFIVISAMSVFFFSNQQVIADISKVPSTLARTTEFGLTQIDSDTLKAKIRDKLGLTIIKIEKTPLPGVALLVTDQGLFYSSYNGDYFIQGKIYSLVSGVTDLAEQSVARIRLDGMEKFKDDMIVYKAKDEKYVVTVFTDITCGYCRKMHKQMDDYNERGITFRYLAYPRSGIQNRQGNFTEGFKELRSVWCSEDPKAAMTDAKNGRGIAYRVCENPIEAQFDFGRQVGVNGTPAIILSTGMMLPGYQPPEQLEQLLKTL